MIYIDTSLSIWLNYCLVNEFRTFFKWAQVDLEKSSLNGQQRPPVDSQRAIDVEIWCFRWC